MAHHDELSLALLRALQDARTSAERLALDAELGKDTVGRWIRGETVPRLTSLRKVEHHLSLALRTPIDLSPALKIRQRAATGDFAASRPQRGAGVCLHTYLGRLLAADYARSGPRTGQFGALSDRHTEAFYQQPGSQEPPSLKPSYFHTFWGLLGVGLLLPAELESYRSTTANAIARRFADRSWLTLSMPDYEAAPMQGTSTVRRIRHTARAAGILFLCDRHIDLATDLVWLLVTDLPELLTRGGVPEVLAANREPSLHASAAVLQAISLASAHPGLADRMEFVERSQSLRSGIEAYLRSEWNTYQWAFGDLPWWLNAPPLLGDVAAHVAPDLRTAVASRLRDELLPSGHLHTRTVGAFDAPGPMLDLRTAFAVAQDPVRRTDSRLQQVVGRLSELSWDDQPLLTADITYLASLVGTRDDSETAKRRNPSHHSHP